MIDVKEFLQKEKLDVEFVKTLHEGNNVGTIISARVVIIPDPKEGDKKVLELGVDFAKLGVKKTMLANQTTMLRLSEVWGYDAEKFLSHQVRPTIEIWKNNRAGVVLEPINMQEGVISDAKR